MMQLYEKTAKNNISGDRSGLARIFKGILGQNLDATGNTASNEINWLLASFPAFPAFPAVFPAQRLLVPETPDLSLDNPASGALSGAAFRWLV